MPIVGCHSRSVGSGMPSVNPTDSINAMATGATQEPIAKWHVDRTINLPILFTIVGAVVAVIIAGNGVVHRVESLEKTANQGFVERTQIRTELLQAQAQQRIESTAQFNKLETKIESEIRELRNVIQRATQR